MFTARVLEHFYNPRNCGAMEGATHRGVAGVPGDGPYVALWFQVEGGRIARATYETYGCPAAVACASIAAQLLPGRTVAQALLLTAEDLERILGGLPEGKHDCARRAAEAVGRAFQKEEIL